MKTYLLLTVIVGSLLLAACTPIQPVIDAPGAELPAPAGKATAEGTATPFAKVEPVEAGVISVDDLMNASYSGIYDEPITLTEGVYEGTAVEGDPARPTVEYIPGAGLYGDLDGDGVDDAVVFLLERGGGSGAFTYVAAQLNRDGKPVDAGAVRIEDRIQVRLATIEDRQIVLDIITEGPGDVACCGSHKAHKTYALQEGRLVETAAEGSDLQRVSVADLNGTSWTLLEPNGDQPAPADGGVTISFQEGRISGFGGCNNYTGSFSLGDVNPFVMTTGPIAATKKSCPDPVASQETAFFTALEGVSQWGYEFGRLGLYYKNDGGELSRLLFARQAGPGAVQSETLTGRTWQWVSFTNPMEQFDVETPESYLLTFNPDGTANVVADCNNAAGSYTADTPDAGALTIQIGPATMAACPPGSRGEQFVTLLGGAARYFFRDGKLFIDLMADGGTMAFAPAGAEAAMPGGGLPGEAWDAVLSQWIAPDNGLCDAPGGVLLVDSPAGRYLKAAGMASVDDGRPLAVDDRLQIGSNTKAFTVILALQLQEEGVLSMDDPLGKRLPDLAAEIPNGDKVTLRQLAGNTSGIPDYADPLMQPLVDNNDQEGLAKGYAPQELVEYAIANGKPDFAPGEGWHYSSTNFILLGMAIEAATGKPLSELYQTRVFDPLGMENSSYLERSPKPGSIVDGYYKVPKGQLTDMTNWNATQGGAAGAIVSTAEDMARFIKGLFGGELFQKEETLSEMTDFRELDYGEGGGIFAGYGLGLISFEAPFKAIGHAGQTPGFQSLWFWAPETQTAVVLLTNSGSCKVMFLPASLTPDLFPLGKTTSTGGNMSTKTSEGAKPTAGTPAGGKPEYVAALEAAYGAPSQAGFGSAVFTEQLKASDKLDQAALAKYKYFTGELWERWGEDAWMGPWKEVYARKAGAKPDIVAELRGISDPDAKISVPMILDNIDGAEQARAALSAAYDDPAVTELRVFTLGDGAAMSGILVAGRRAETGEATFLVFLLD
jgi:D-alanyl-D-alanine carboxypeptidase